MPSVDDLKNSKYLKQSDCHPPIMVTIDHYEEHNMAQEGKPMEMKYVLYFKEDVKPMALNSTNGELIASINGSRNLDRWPGTVIVLYKDDNIFYGGKKVGGIRVRPPRSPAPPIYEPPVTDADVPMDVDDEQIPF